NTARGLNSGHDFLTPLQNKGFIYYGFDEGKKSKYALTMYDNAFKQLWSTDASQESKEIEIANDAFQTETHIGSLVTRKKSALSKDANYDLMLHDVKTGKELFKGEITDDKYNVSASKITYDEATKNIMIFGEYFNLNDKEAKSASLGYFYQMMDLNGKIV